MGWIPIALGTLILLPYVLMMILFFMGWQRTKTTPLVDEPALKVSVLIPFKDEGAVLSKLVADIRNMDYPHNLLEWILINDHSTDDGRDLISTQLQNNTNIILLDAPNDQRGKKAALKQGLNRASGEIILQTDADCSLKKTWVRAMLAPFSEPGAHWVQGPVLLESAGKMMGFLQQTEFLSLMMSAAGSLGIKRGILASAANLAAKKSTYTEAIEGIHPDIPSGDDMFLLETVKARYPDGLHFCKNPQAIVTTEPELNSKILWNQRTRWSSKSPAYKDSHIIMAALVVFVLNLSIVVSLLLAFFFPQSLLIAGLIWLGKVISEIPLMWSGYQFYSIQKHWPWFVLTQTVYPLYIVASALGGWLRPYTWKSRRS